MSFLRRKIKEVIKGVELWGSSKQLFQDCFGGKLQDLEKRLLLGLAATFFKS